MSSQFKLLKETRFRPFFLTQLLGPLNANVFKTALITLIAFRAGTLTGLDPKMLATALPGLFVLPFFLFSATCGQLADRYDRARLARLSKLFECAIMLLASWGFIVGSFAALVVALFLMGSQIALFGPVKYAYLPQHLREHELTGGNGMVEAATFISILTGQIAGAALASAGDMLHIALALCVIAAAGWLFSRGIPDSPPPDPTLTIDWNPLSATRSVIASARSDRGLWLCLLGIAWFWFYGAVMLAQFPVYTQTVLGGSEQVYILILCIFSIGVGAGSLLCERLSRGRVEAGLVPIGALGMTLFGMDLFLATPPAALAHDGSAADFLLHATHWRMLADIALVGAAGGLYVVPLYAMMQARCSPRYTARIIASSNILNAGLMFVSSLVCLALLKAGFGIPHLFLALALGTALIALWLCASVPEFWARCVLWLMTRTVHRVNDAAATLPERGAGVLVMNGEGLLPALLVSAVSRRPVRMVIEGRHFERRLTCRLLSALGCIPGAGADGLWPTGSREAIATALAEGELVGLPAAAMSQITLPPDVPRLALALIAPDLRDGRRARPVHLVCRPLPDTPTSDRPLATLATNDKV